MSEEREIIELHAFDYRMGVYTGKRMWGVNVIYRTRRDSEAHKPFYEVDELGAYLAFQKHCARLDRVLARKGAKKNERGAKGAGDHRDAPDQIQPHLRAQYERSPLGRPRRLPDGEPGDKCKGVL